MFKLFKREKQAVLISNNGKEFVLDSESPNQIGRGHSASVFIEDDMGASRKNSLITYYEQAKTFYIKDLESKHGTRVNGELIAEKKELKDGDMIEVGRFTKFIFQIK